MKHEAATDGVLNRCYVWARPISSLAQIGLGVEAILLAVMMLLS